MRSRSCGRAARSGAQSAAPQPWQQRKLGTCHVTYRMPLPVCQRLDSRTAVEHASGDLIRTECRANNDSVSNKSAAAAFC